MRLQVGSKGVELATYRRLHSSFDSRVVQVEHARALMQLFTLYTFGIDEDAVDAIWLFEDEEINSCFAVR